MFLDEVQLSQTLNHTNVVKVFGGYRCGEYLILAMEYLDGVDLRSIYKTCSEKQLHMSIPMILCIGRYIARGLGYAHLSRNSKGILRNVVHRDVSPSQRYHD